MHRWQAELSQTVTLECSGASLLTSLLPINWKAAVAMQEPTILSLSGAVLICVSTFSLGAFEKTHPKPSTSPDVSLRDGSAAQDSLGQYEPVLRGPSRTA